MKSLIEFLETLVLLPFALVLVGLAGLLIKWEDGGPVFYRRGVVGPKGDFDAYKLRTMRVDADVVLQRRPQLWEEFQANFKLREDPRVTRVGRYLRKWSLDELPQLLNVLRGQMSLVGPRMKTRTELEKYGPYRDLVLSVKPGLTGYWQVSGRQDVSYEERVNMDVFYVQNWSLRFDFKILLKTAWKVLKREGAY
jgi:lipopolysaccharide/colanic/teichoic acid biosynthesis glycosyltransferase